MSGFEAARNWREKLAMCNSKIKLLTLADRLRTEADAYELLEEMRWGDQPVCPHCGSVRKHYFLTPANGTSRKTRTGAASERRVWKCADCRKQFTVLVGTIFHGTSRQLERCRLTPTGERRFAPTTNASEERG